MAQMCSPSTADALGDQHWAKAGFQNREPLRARPHYPSLRMGAMTSPDLGSKTGSHAQG